MRCLTKRKLVKDPYQACSNCAPDVDRARSGAQNLLDAPDFSGATNLLLNR